MDDLLISAITGNDLELVDSDYDDAFAAIAEIMESFGIEAMEAGTPDGLRHLRSNAQVQAQFERNKLN